MERVGRTSVCETLRAGIAYPVQDDGATEQRRGREERTAGFNDWWKAWRER